MVHLTTMDFLRGLVHDLSFSCSRAFVMLMFSLTLHLQVASAQNRPADDASKTSLDRAPRRSGSIPPGTILPVRIGSLSSEKSKVGTRLKARLMQDVPMENGEKLRAGSMVLGQVVASTPIAPGTMAALTLRFNTVVQRKQSFPVCTSLRAMASTLEVQFAQTPTVGPGESDVYDWLPTVQVGGEVVYGKWGEVTNGDRVVGRSTYDGVLAQPNAKAGTKCSGAVEANDRPQAFWVFSSDACGVYSFPDLSIRHAGRTDPRGEIVLVSGRGAVKIRSGSGMLLRVQR